MAALDVCVLGSLNLDFVIRCERFPRPGETLLAGPFESFPGGKGANQAVAAARLGARVALIGRVGADAHGATLLDEARREGVDVEHVERTREQATGVAVITVDARGENHILVAPGANAAVTPAFVERSRSRIESSSLLLAQLEVPLDAFEAAARIARSAGVRVALNAAPARALSRDLLGLVDLLVVNETEARATLGRGEDPPALASGLTDLGPALAVVTLGARGAIAFERGTATWVQRDAFPVVAVDTTAAGDAFTAAFALEFARRSSLERALDRANAAGAIACTRRGAQPSLPRLEELDAWLVRAIRRT